MSMVRSKDQDKPVVKNQRNESFCRKLDIGGLSFLQSMSDFAVINRDRDDTAYVHPNVNRSVSKLNKKSLEMCTESLGNETGSESGDELSFLASEATLTSRAPPPLPQPKHQEDEDIILRLHSRDELSFPLPQPKPQEEDSTLLMKKPSRNKSFPPPIGSSKYNRIVRSLGDDGNLVVRAIKVSSPPRCSVAERSEGRLRLSLSPESSLLRHNHEEEEEADETEDGIEEENVEKLKGKSGHKMLERLLGSRCKENGHETKPMLTWFNCKDMTMLTLF